ncbi:aldo/keto reductase [Chitinophaga filiformis]|uniref:aldo/keto reductase n=1 Tax=Chitinophaga filiformis TaxID=104663 RepID=UPI001F32C9E0|nr:aldo/keto reductase [Chitinophaga filiformis]MCF6406176.1 aldo/keto reductase [Chitinophaga filiformis]
MKYKVLGNTGLAVSTLCLGTMTFGGKGIYQVVGTLGQPEVDKLFKRAVDAGINFIDTANIYSEGMSEELTGQAIRNLGLKRDDLVIATKVCAAMGAGLNDKGLSRKHIMQQVEASLKRLNTDYIDLYQAHAYDPVVPLEETLRAMDDLITSGKVRYIGASNNGAWHLMKALACAEKHNLHAYISMQSHYSIATRELEREVIPALVDQRVGLMVWSPLVAGLLSGKYKRNGESTEEGRYKKFSFIPVDTERAFNILDVLQEMAAEKGSTVAQLSLAWLLHQPAVTSVIIGANNLSQLDDNLQSVNVQFTAEELQRLDDVSRLPVEYPNWIFDWRNR